MELNRENDFVYQYTTNVIVNVKQLMDYINKGEVELYLDQIKDIGLELRKLLSTVDELIDQLPKWSHNEISLVHKMLPKDFGSLADSMKQAQKYNNTSIESEFKKKMYKNCHVLVINCKSLLETIDTVRLKILKEDEEEVLEQ